MNQRGRSRTRRGQDAPLRGGFSLIELLIVVAIIAALVGVAVPFFQDNLAEAQRAKALQDLEHIRKAISRYEQQEQRPLSGSSLHPLEGRYMQELPVDPWGNPYLWDGAAGRLLSYGADAFPGGAGGDADIIHGTETHIPGVGTFRNPVFYRRVQYQGAWGPPMPPRPHTAPDWTKHADGNAFVITFTRPIQEVDPTKVAEHLEIFHEDEGTAGAMLLTHSTFAADTWRSAADPFFPADAADPRHDPAIGVLVVRATANNRQKAGGPSTPIRPGLVMGMRLASLDEAFRTTWTVDADPRSPLDPTVYGPEAQDLLPDLYPSPDVELSGVRIEKY